MPELSKQFDFKSVDEKWAKEWVKAGCFHAQPDASKTPYTIVIPPPNVTGILHMGHALNNTLQDIIIRYKRMKGFETLWMPGTDHAGIATQNVVEKQLAKEGKKRQDIGREKFLEHLWEWKNQSGDIIINQLKSIGASCDWQRTRFTMDDGYSEAVKEAFVLLYHKGLIYQGEYIINWCPRCQTALSDEEVEHEDVKGTLTRIRYALKDNSRQFIVVATTRPETMLGDTAVAVHPHDERYKQLIGKTVVLPLIHREIPIIADEFVDPAFGTGAVKVTPAHDPNDFQMGRRHSLPFVNVMHPNGVINENGGAFSGMDRFKARKAIVEALKEKDLIVKIDKHNHAVGHCYRCHTVVEPYLSKQWFVKMKPLAAPALKAFHDGRVRFYPERWNKVYINWMEGIRDWCISRQIWWGHRVPVWYCAGDGKCLLKCKEPIVSKDIPECCPHCGSKNLKQDEDVLDTWFSSWLWPFATLGWPEETQDLKYFYPGDALFTASEIIFFWVARMIMAGLEFRGEVPFKDVYIHGTVRDSQGRKMSKSLGNAIDPLEIIREYGADSLRYSLIINSGQDVFISKDKFEIGRNFANKIWNATRLVLMNVPEFPLTPSFAKRGEREFFDLSSVAANPRADLPLKWIVSQYYSTLSQVDDAIEHYRYSEAENLVYEFFKGYFCDWHLEIIKDRWQDEFVQNVTMQILTGSLKMIHPFMPFVTEEIWNHLEPQKGLLCRQPWPVFFKNGVDIASNKDMEVLIHLITGIRNLKAQWNIKLNQTVDVTFQAADDRIEDIIKNTAGVFSRLAGVKNYVFVKDCAQLKNSALVVVEGIHCAVDLKGLIDIEQEKRRLQGLIGSHLKLKEQTQSRLANEAFISKAPESVINAEKNKLESLGQEVARLQQLLDVLS